MNNLRCAFAAALVISFAAGVAAAEAPPQMPRPHIARQPLENPRAVVPIQAVLIGDEDCVDFDPASVKAQGNLVRAGNKLLLHYGPDFVTAKRAAEVIKGQAFDRQCFVGHLPGQLMYWKAAGNIPSTQQPGEDCAPVNPASTFVGNFGNGWVVLSGAALLASYGTDRAAADRAVLLVKAYKPARQCFIKRPNAVMTYWLK